MAAADSHGFGPTATWEMLRLRASLLRKLRQFFEERDFLEVETPLLSADTVVDLHIDPLPVTLLRDPREPAVGPRLWLQTSPEFGMKRLLAAGAQRIYQITRAFRAGEAGDRHNPEFTIVEWYRVGDGLAEGLELLAELAQVMFDTRRVERISYEAAFARELEVHPHLATTDEFAAVAARRNLAPPPGLGSHRDGWLNYLLAECIESTLGRDCPTILYDYPASQAALARVRTVTTDSPDSAPRTYQVAERFELYYRGVELANGYHELLDASVLRDRNRLANDARAADGRYRVPEESRLLEAMAAGLPPCCGVALGFDRLVMVAAGARNLREVMAFPIDRA